MTPAALPTAAIEHAVVDTDGRLVSSDPRLLALNARAGGELGAPLAVPQIATLARLAGRLGVLISRGVIAADGDADVDLWVRAEPVEDGVRLAVTGWQRRDAWPTAPSSLAREEAFLHSDADWVWETDAGLCLTFVSTRMPVDGGDRRATLLGRPITGLFALDEGAEGAMPMLQALALRDRFDGQPARLRATGMRLLLSAVPRVDAGGRFTGFLGAAREVPGTATQPAAPAFGERLDQALRAPLVRIIAGADSIGAQDDGPLPADYAGYAVDIATAGRHLLGLVDDLVDLEAIERPDFAVASEPLDLADLARRAAGLLAMRASQGRVRIERPAPDVVLPVSGEYRRTLQVLVNLIGNAVRYAPEDSDVAITPSRPGEPAAVTIADRGKGIAPEDQLRIFAKFERIDPSEPGGSGLGLYIARRLARAMGGDVTVDSAAGAGARFTFTLPAA